jgi:hypothetical protein
MNAKVVGLLVGLLVIIGLAYMLMNGSGDIANTEQSPSSSPSEQASNQTGSLRGLMSMSSPQECTFSDTEANGSTSGTVFVANGKMRGDFSTTASGQTTLSHMIVMNDTSYVWTDSMAQGMKMSFSSMESNAQAQQNQSVDVNKNVNYSCKSWAPDDGRFQLPGNIQFTDMSAMMNAQVSGNASGNAAQCGACDSLQGSARTQCRAALNCK